jgi:hypothetical protein
VQPDEVRIYRRASRWLLFILEAFVALFGTIVVLSDSGPAARIVAGAFGAPCFWFAWRTQRLAVLVGKDGLFVRNYFRDHWLAWGQIAGADAPPPYDYWGLRNRGLQIRLRDGTTISASAFMRGQIDVKDVGSELVNYIRNRARQG